MSSELAVPGRDKLDKCEAMDRTLGSRLKAARTAAGLTQADVAKNIGVSPQAIQHLETGNSRSSRHLHRIARILGVTAEWLETGDDSGPNSSINHVAENILAVMSQYDDAAESESSGLAFYPPETLSYKPNHLPVYVSLPLTFLILRNRLYEKLLNRASLSLKILPGALTEKDPSKFVGFSFSACIAANPDDYFPRPAYLLGQADAYGLFPAFQTHMNPRLTGGELLHIDPHATPSRGSLVIVWLKTGAFLVAQFSSSSPESINLFVHQSVELGLIKVILNAEDVRAVHTVRGLEFTEPRSAKVRFGSYSYTSEGQVKSGTFGLGGIDAESWDGPDEPI